LYFVGGSIHPGNGLPLVLLSARLTTERIFNEIGVPKTRLASSFYPVSMAKEKIYVD
jgi:hypothetical protein